MPKIKNPGQFIDLGYFTWQRTNNGYCFEFHDTIIGDDGLDKKSPDNYLIAQSSSTLYYRYKPFKDYPTLFLQFAELKKTEESILKFANKFGHLTNADYLLTDLTVAEPYNFWVKEISDMHEAVRLWDWIREKNLEILNIIIQWKKRDEVNNINRVCYFLGSEEKLLEYQKSGRDRTSRGQEIGRGFHQGILASETFNQEIFLLLKFNDVMLPALCLLQKLINKKLEKYKTLPRLLINDKGELMQYLYPEDLLAAMWFQFYQAVTGEKIFKKCSSCHYWADVTDKNKNWTKHPECANRDRVNKIRNSEKGS